MFSTLSKRSSIVSVTSNLSFANPFSLDKAPFLSFGKELFQNVKICHLIAVVEFITITLTLYQTKNFGLVQIADDKINVTQKLKFVQTTK